MKRNVTIILLILILVLFAPNIYYEISNVTRANAWYESIHKKDLSGKKAQEALYSFQNIGYKTIEIKKEKNGGYRYILAPPFDQGFIATLFNRYFFITL